MTTIIIVGSNTFDDCATLIGIRGRDLLRVEVSPLRVSLVTPKDLPSRRFVEVVDNAKMAEAQADVQVIATDKSVAIFFAKHPLVIATLIDPQTVNLKLDLRRIGINVYDDGQTLHIGTGQLIASTMRGCATAIRLG